MTGEPQTDLRASNNIVHIRTCADSTVALMDLIKYIACDGDLSDANLKDDLKINSTSDSKDVLVNLNSEKFDERSENDLLLNQRNNIYDNEGVHHLVEEAMNDTTVVEHSKKKSKFLNLIILLMITKNGFVLIYF